jgi:PII-like signaling protein
MQGVYLKLFVPENQRHDGLLLYEWLLEEAKRFGLPGGSAFRAIAGFGRHGVLHEQQFFELAGQLPVEVAFALPEALAERWLGHLASMKLPVVYVRYPADIRRLDGDG